jgi:hypothetical protein
MRGKREMGRIIIGSLRGREEIDIERVREGRQRDRQRARRKRLVTNKRKGGGEVIKKKRWRDK